MILFNGVNLIYVDYLILDNQNLNHLTKIIVVTMTAKTLKILKVKVNKISNLIRHIIVINH